jgi:hypothetical protein
MMMEGPGEVWGSLGRSRGSNNLILPQKYPTRLPHRELMDLCNDLTTVDMVCPSALMLGSGCCRHFWEASASAAA